MRVHITGEGVQIDQTLHQFAERRLALALGRFGSRVRRVSVRFWRGEGPTRAAARCRLGIALASPPPLVVEREGSCVHVALEGAAERAERAVERRLAARQALAGRP